MKQIWMNRNRLAAMLLAGLVLCSSLPLEVCADELSGSSISADTAADTGRFEQEIIMIESKEDLLAVAKYCTLDSYSYGKTFLLEQDIDLEGSELMIPSFSGVFDGQGHKISGLSITGNVSAAGLFGTVQQSGVVKNLRVEGAVVPEGEKSRVGGIVGINEGTILGCTFSGVVRGSDYVGGISGTNGTNGQLLNTVTEGVVIGTHYTGGTTGQNEGVIFSCRNEAAVNTEVPDEEDSLESISDTLYRLWKTYDRQESHPSMTDTGGIAGYSTGIIKNSTNIADVGYPHVGYNVGGIVGRQCGYVGFCGNQGHIYGRKDVGGIAGQMAPDVSLLYENSTISEIRKELNQLDVLLDQLLTDGQNSGDIVSARVRQISSYVDEARASAEWMGDYMVDYANEGIGQINDLSATMNSYMERLRPIREGMDTALEKVHRGMDRLEVLQDKIQDEQTREQVRTLQEKLEQQIEKLEQLLQADEPDVNALRQSVEEIGDTLAELADVLEQYSDQDFETDIEEIVKCFREAYETFEGAAKELSDWMADLSGEEPVTISPINGEFHTQSQRLSSSLTSISNQMSILNDEMGNSGDKLTADVRAVSDQFMKIMNLFLDAIDEVREVSYEDVYEDASEEDIANTVQGKVEGCSNAGIIEADVNVGGIAGALAMEYDLDPEDDQKDAEHKSYRYTYQTKAILLNCVNSGEVLAKKNCAGGLVGRMDLGIVVGGENYGMISSSSGDYVGGVCGYALSAIRDSYAKGILSGKNYIGGIVGSGDTVKNCRSIVTVADGEQFVGAIAGEVTGAACENYFISEQLAGIDKVSYSGQAEPVSYEQLLTMPGVPEGFYSFTVTFRIDERLEEKEKAQQELKNYQYTVQDVLHLPYGSMLTEENYPVADCPEGYYFIWDKTELTPIVADTIVTGNYLQYATLLSGDVLQEDGRPAVLVEGKFRQDDVVVTENISMPQADSRIHGQTIVEQWSVSWPEDGLPERNLRYHPNGGDTKKLEIYVREGENWEKANTSISGGHILIAVTGSETEFAVTEKEENHWIWIAIGAALLLAVGGTIVRKKLAKKSTI